jgi:cellulose biosynthesis protein BcsE
MSMRIGIEDIEGADGVLPGRWYGIIHDSPDLIRGFILGTLVQPGSRGYYLTTGESTSLFLGRDPLTQQALAASQTDQIKVFGIRQRARNSILKLVEELERLRIPANALVIVEGAEQLWEWRGSVPITLHYSHTLLLLFDYQTMGSERLSKLLAQRDRLAGLSHLKQEGTKSVWSLYHWFSPKGLTVMRNWLLDITPEGNLKAIKALNTPCEDLAPGSAIDADIVYATQAVLRNDSPPENWRVAEELADLEPLIANAVGAAVVIPWDHRDHRASFDELARWIFKVRKEKGTSLRILVREMGTHMRYPQENLLFKVGVNQVIPAKTSFSRLLNMINNSRGQRIPSILYEHFDEITTLVTPYSLQQGYLHPPDFLLECRQDLVSVNALAIQSILVRLPLAPGMTALDALHACDIKRKGDICTAIPDSLYVFLFACREGDVDLALGHIFTLPIDMLFEGQLRFSIPTTIEHGLNDLANILNTSVVPNYTDELNVPAGYGTLAANILLEAPRFDRTTSPPAIRHPYKIRPDV